MTPLPSVEYSVFLLIDQQERLVKAIDDAEAITARQTVMLRGAELLGLDTIVTEQYPKGLGHTVPEIAGLLTPETNVIAKTAFSAFGEPAFRSALRQRPRADLFVAGIESHICVLQTVFDALAGDLRVWVLADAIGSRRAADRELALAAMRQRGAEIIPVEAALFMLLGDARHAAFKGVSALIK